MRRRREGAGQAPGLVLYTDGGASPNPGPGGWAVVATQADEVVFERSGSEAATTNNRMELTAAIEALASQPEGATLRVVTDSQYLRQGITSWIKSWRRNRWMRGRPPHLEPVKNADLWKRLDALAAHLQVDWSWVKGHAGNRFNERADALASEEIARRTGTAAGIVGGGSAFLADSDQIPAATTLTLAVRFSGGRGSWCASVAGAAETETLIQGAPRATSSANRLELDAGVHLLEILDSWPDPVEIRCGDYLRRGATEWLAKWRAAGWRTAAGDEVKNSDLWQRLEPLLESHRSAQREVRFAKIDSKSPEVKELKKALR